MLRRAVIAALLLAPATLAHASNPEERKKGGGQTFLQLPTLSASITRANGSRGVVTVEVGIDGHDAATYNQLVALQPRLRASFNQFLTSYVAGLGRGSAVNADYLAQGLQRQTDTILGKPGAKFLVGSILMN